MRALPHSAQYGYNQTKLAARVQYTLRNYYSDADGPPPANSLFVPLGAPRPPGGSGGGYRLMGNVR